MKRLFLVLVFSLMACEKKQSEVVPTPQVVGPDELMPFYGTWYFVTDEAIVGDWNYSTVKMDRSGNIEFKYTINSGNNPANTGQLYRKSVGRFSVKDGHFTITYTYESCFNVGSEVLKMSIEKGKLFIQVPGSYDAASYNKIYDDFVLIKPSISEDRSCNRYTKKTSIQKRSVASKAKSVLDEMRKK